MSGTETVFAIGCFVSPPRNGIRFPRIDRLNQKGGVWVVLSRSYFVRQAASLLTLARQISDTNLSAALLKKATELNEQAQEAKPRSDMSPRPPDVDRRA